MSVSEIKDWAMVTVIGCVWDASKQVYVDRTVEYHLLGKVNRQWYMITRQNWKPVVGRQVRSPAVVTRWAKRRVGKEIKHLLPMSGSIRIKMHMEEFGDEVDREENYWKNQPVSDAA